MPNCSKCGSAQAKFNKGALCKRCFNNKINPAEKVIATDDNIDDPVHNAPFDDRNLIDFIKSQMIKETQWHNELVQVYKEQIDYLKGEIEHKNIIINKLLISKTETPPIINSDINDSIKENTSLISNISSNNNKSNHVIISPDVSITDNGNYESIEPDDLLYNANDKWTEVNNSSHKNNHESYIPQPNYDNIVHPNIFNGLQCHNNEEIINMNAGDQEINGRVNHSNNNNYARHSEINYRPNIVTQEYPENNFISPPIKPGINAYNEAVK